MILRIDNLPAVIEVGVQDENGVTDIRIDMSPWLDKWPDMLFTVMVTRPGEEESMPVNSTLTGTVLSWHVNDTDTEISGEGRMEIIGETPDGKHKKSGDKCATLISGTTTGSTKEPTPAIEPYYKAMLQAAEEVKQAAEDVQGVIDAGESGIYLVRATPDPDFNNFPRSDRTQEEIRAAVAAGKTVLMVYTALKNEYSKAIDARVMTYVGEVEDSYGNPCPTFDGYIEDNSDGIPYYYQAFVQSSGIVGRRSNVLRATTKRPLKLTGAVEATFDGREEVTVDVPDVMIVRIAGIASGVACSHTKDEIKAAVAAGKTCLLIDANGCVYTYIGEGADYTQNPVEEGCPRFSAHFGIQGTGGFAWTVLVRGDGTVFVSSSEGLKTLKIKQGDTTTEYNGSKAISVDIPEDKLFVVTAQYVDGMPHADRTLEEILAAVSAGKVCLLVYDGYAMIYADKDNEGNARFNRLYVPYSYNYGGFGIWSETATVKADGTIVRGTTRPMTTPNPYTLTIRHGDTVTEYNGSEAITVEIPAGGGLPSGSAPHQQLVTNATGATEWQERTHYEAITEGAVLAETTISLQDDDGVQMGMATDAYATPIDGEEYTVIVNGTTYKTACQAMEDDGALMAYCFGNVSFMETGESTGEPFVVILFAPDWQAGMGGVTAVVYDITGLLDGSGSVATEMTLSITGPRVERKQLDEKYIPATIARKAEVVTSVNGNTGDVIITELPSVTTIQNGYFLRVVSGSWAAVKVDSAEGASF